MVLRRCIILAAAVALTTLASQTRAFRTSQQIGTIAFHKRHQRIPPRLATPVAVELHSMSRTHMRAVRLSPH